MHHFVTGHIYFHHLHCLFARLFAIPCMMTNKYQRMCIKNFSMIKICWGLCKSQGAEPIFWQERMVHVITPPHPHPTPILMPMDVFLKSSPNFINFSIKVPNVLNIKYFWFKSEKMPYFAKWYLFLEYPPSWKKKKKGKRGLLLPFFKKPGRETGCCFLLGLN